MQSVYKISENIAFEFYVQLITKCTHTHTQLITNYNEYTQRKLEIQIILEAR